MGSLSSDHAQWHVPNRVQQSCGPSWRGTRATAPETLFCIVISQHSRTSYGDANPRKVHLLWKETLKGKVGSSGSGAGSDGLDMCLVGIQASAPLKTSSEWMQLSPVLNRVWSSGTSRGFLHTWYGTSLARNFDGVCMASGYA